MEINKPTLKSWPIYKILTELKSSAITMILYYQDRKIISDIAVCSKIIRIKFA
jgi:hypothetical protein